ncbi:MAG: porin [Burkholderiaceae bacterium]
MMKKLSAVATLAALCALAAPAAAQTKVELYGVLDGGLQYIDRADIGGVAQDSTFGVSSGTFYGNRFGLRGSENLGGGVKAIFALENGFNLDTGKLGEDGNLFSRQAYLGLDSGMGKVAIGRLAALSSAYGDFDMSWQMDPFEGGMGDAGLSAFPMPWNVNNAAVYRSPDMKGLIVSGMYSFATDGKEQPGLDNNTRYAGVAANYAVGGLWSGLTYETITAVANSGIADQKILKVAANYDFGMVKPFLAYAKGGDWQLGNNYQGGDLGTTAFDTDSYLVGFTAPLFKGLLRGSYQLLDGKAANNAAGEKVEAERQVWSLGYTYDLSKRTTVYGVVSMSIGGQSFDKDDQAGYQMANLEGRSDYNRTMTSVGLKHSF